MFKLSKPIVLEAPFMSGKMSKRDVDHIKVLSDPNRLAILSLLSMRELTATQISQIMDISVQNAQYHIRKLVDAELVSHTRSGVTGNLVEKYYRSAFEPGKISEMGDEATIDVSERSDLIFAAMGAIKGILDRGIRILDNKDEERCLEPEEFSGYPFGVNYIVIPNTPESTERAESLVARLEDDLRAMSDEFGDDGKDRFALMYALFPYD